MKFRATSTCGYPAVNLEFLNEFYKNDLDVAFATADDIFPDLDIEKWPRWTSKWNGSFSQNPNSKYLRMNISEGYENERLNESTWTSCNDSVRNLWITLTRLPKFNIDLLANNNQDNY